MSEATGLLKARWVFPVDRSPIEDGLIEITDGRIVRLDSGSDPEAIDLGDVAVVPGLVNAHTHLEFSHLKESLRPPAPFEAWVHSVVKSRHERWQPIEPIIRLGLDESKRSGTTLLGEIATSEISKVCPDETTPRMVAFREVLGLDDAAINHQQVAVTCHLNTSAEANVAHLVRGLSPHAPYSVHPDLLQWTIDQARQSGMCVAMHLAETRAELELLERGTGPLVRMLEEFGLWQESLFPGGQTVMAFLEPLSALDRVLVVHGNYLTAEEIRFLTAHPQFSVVYCPRTHAYFGHGEHPWRTLLESGVVVALGTDSRASNPDLSLWREVLFLRESAPDVPDETLLRMATLNGAKSLGLEEETGTLTPGKCADLAVVQFGETGGHDAAESAHKKLLHPRSRIIAAIRSGRWLHGLPPR